MKKYIAVFTAALLLCLCSCADKTGIDTDTAINTLPQTEEQTVAPETTGIYNTPFTVEYSGNPTTGYLWLYEVTSGAENISVTVNEEVSHETESMGSSEVSYIYTVTGLKEGSATVVFWYAQPWNESSADETHTFTFTVDKSGNVSGTED